MKKILLISSFSSVSKELFNELAKYFSVRLVEYNFEQIESALFVEPVDAVVVYIKNLERAESLALHMFFQNEKYGKTPTVLIGSRDECKENMGKWGVNIVKIILTPTKISIIVQTAIDIFDPKIKTTKEPEDKRKQILVVDDDVLLLRSVTNMLNDLYKVASVKSGSAAISFLTNHKPDLILLDYAMPVCDGPQTFQMIKAEEATKNIPIFFLTGMSDEEHVKNAMSLKPEGYILKTCSAGELLNRIGDFFEK